MVAATDLDGAMVLDLILFSAINLAWMEAATGSLDVGKAADFDGISALDSDLVARFGLDRTVVIDSDGVAVVNSYVPVIVVID